MADDREKFAEFVKTVSGLILTSSSLYDNYFDIESVSYVPWERKVPEYIPPANKKFS